MVIAGFFVGVLLVRLLTPAAVVLEWETASEVGTLGFFIYRAENPEGPFTRLNTEPIPVQDGTLTGAKYTYRDTTTRWGHRYYYQLESLEQDGRTLRYPDMVESRAGLDWPWLVLGGTGAALLTGLWLSEKSPRKRRDDV